jgi:hypothetical protein
MRLLGWTGYGPRSDGGQVIVHRGHAFIARVQSNGFSVVDVRDPRSPQHRLHVPARPWTWTRHLQVTQDDLLILAEGADLEQFKVIRDEGERSDSQGVYDGFRRRGLEHAAGIRIYDVSDPLEPREIGALHLEGQGVHRVWYTGGRYAYVSAHLDGFLEHVLVVVDVSDPTTPREVGRWWIPGMWAAGGEERTWPEDRRFALHHAIVAGDRAYGAWRDGGFTILDVSAPERPELLSHINWSPPFGGGTHSPLPLPDRDLAVVLDEAGPDPTDIRYTWVVDVREPTNPVTISTFPTPVEEDYPHKGLLFGPHNLHENRPGSFQSSELIFATYQSAGVRAVDISDPFAPREVGHLVPGVPAELGADAPPVVQTHDCFVDTEGVMYFTDKAGCGLHTAQFEGA